MNAGHKPFRSKTRQRRKHLRDRPTLSYTPTGQVVSYSYDVAQRLTAAQDNRGARISYTLASMGESAQITFWHNALGQRTFKSEPKAQSYAPNEAQLGTEFVAWLRKNFSWLFDRAQANATLGQVFLYAPEQLAAGAPMLLGEYGNGAARAADRTEYLYLPSDASGNAASNGSAALPIPIGLFRSNRFWPIHTDHLATPRLMRDEDGDPVWQWPYSAFGDNKPIGPLRATANPRQAFASVPGQAAQPAQLFRATGPQAKLHLRYPGQYFDEETKLSYNYFRSYDAASGRYTQPDPIGLEGGLNRFAYVEGNALWAVDPLGLASCVYSISTGMMECIPNGSEKSTFQGQFAAGNNSTPGCKNNWECQGIQNVGPLPEGVYEWTGRGRKSPDRRNLTPLYGTQYGRSAFQTHSCENPFGPSRSQIGACSNGCVTATPDTIKQLNRLLDKDRRNVLTVIP